MWPKHPASEYLGAAPSEKAVRRLKVGIRDIQAVSQQMRIHRRQFFIPAFSRDDSNVAGDPAGGSPIAD